MSEQKEFLESVRAVLVTAAKVNEIDSRLSQEIREIRESNKKVVEFQEQLLPVLEAYKRGMTVKAKAGTVAIIYVGLMLLFPQLAPTSILTIIKMIL